MEGLEGKEGVCLEFGQLKELHDRWEVAPNFLGVQRYGSTRGA